MLTPDEAADRMREMSRQLEALEEITPPPVDEVVEKYAAYFRQRAIPPEPKRPVYTPEQISVGHINDTNMVEMLRAEWDSRPRVILEGE